MIACEILLAGFSQPAKMWGNSTSRLPLLMLLGAFVLAISVGKFIYAHLLLCILQPCHIVWMEKVPTHAPSSRRDIFNFNGLYLKLSPGTVKNYFNVRKNFPSGQTYFRVTLDRNVVSQTISATFLA